MKFVAKTEAEVNKFTTREPGVYPFSVAKAEDTQSHAGNDMIALVLTVYDQDGKPFPVRDWVLEAMSYKLRHFAYAIGLGEKYEAGEMTAGDLVGREGRLLLEVEEASGDYPAKNKVKDYQVPKEGMPAKVVKAAAAPVPKAAVDVRVATDDATIPF